jgi:uncharacterized protein (TIGR00297 family)
LATAVLVNLVVASIGWHARSLTRAGASAAAAIGAAIAWGSGWRSWILLVVMYAMVVIATRWGRVRKDARGIAEDRGGRRGAGNAFANAGVAAACAGMQSVTGSELALVGLVGSLVAAGSDSVASEIGKAWGGPTWRIGHHTRVPPGTTGGLSTAGTAAALAAAVSLAGLAMALGLIGTAMACGIIVASLVAGVLEGMVADRFEARGLIDNNQANLFTATMGALLAIGWHLLIDR